MTPPEQSDSEQRPGLELRADFESQTRDVVEVWLFVGDEDVRDDPFPIRLRVRDDEDKATEAWLDLNTAKWIGEALIAAAARREIEREDWPIAREDSRS